MSTTAAVIAVGAMASCSSSGMAPPPGTTVALTTSSVAHDRHLRLGLLLPSSGPGAALGQSLLAGAELARQQVNAADGVLGEPVTTIVADEGGTATSAAAAMSELIDAEVDVVIGPASSRNAFSVLARAVDAGVAVCSPTNTAIGLSSFPDRGLYFRSMPSDALEAVALGTAVERTGETTVAVAVPDDDFGADFGDALVADLRSRGLTISGITTYDPTGADRDRAVAAVLTDSPENVVLVGSGDGGAAMLTALRSERSELPIFVNDAMKSPSVVAALGERAGSILAGVTGVAPRAVPASASFARLFAAAYPDVSDDFAAYAYDCVNAVAVAARAGDSDDPRVILSSLESVTRSGDLCDGYADCSELLGDGQNINLRGASGDLDLDADGEVVSGTYRVFTFDSAGTAIDGDDIDVP